MKSPIRAACAVFSLSVVMLTGCSLLSIKSPETPLSAREQEARLLTRDYAAHFADVIVHVIDHADRGRDDDPAVGIEALKLKLACVTEVTRASTGLSPIGSLLDTWAFALQLRDFLVTGAAGKLLDPAQSDDSREVQRLADEADVLAQKVLGEDFSTYHAFVLSYVERNPLQSVDFTRPSILAAWAAEHRDKSVLRSVGTVSQALGDVSDRLRVYGERVPSMTLWEAQVALNRAGFDQAAYRSALRNFDAQLERISMLADTSPVLARQAMAELREGLRSSSDRLEGAWSNTLKTFSSERAALAMNMAEERENLVSAFDAQRALLSADADRIVTRAIDTSWKELHKLVREALLLLIGLCALILGLPFAAGYFVGRRSRTNS